MVFMRTIIVCMKDILSFLCLFMIYWNLSLFMKAIGKEDFIPEQVKDKLNTFIMEMAWN